MVLNSFKSKRLGKGLAALLGESESDNTKIKKNLFLKKFLFIF